MTIKEIIAGTESQIKRHVQLGNPGPTLRTSAIQPSVMIGSDNKSDYKIEYDILENVETSDEIKIDWLHTYD